jgi:hypothetical protein
MLISDMGDEEASLQAYKLRVPLYLGMAVTPVFVVFAAVSGGVGHGSYLPAIILFPYWAALVIMFDSIALSVFWPLIALPLALVQYPLYGHVIGSVWVGRRRAFYLVGIGLIHVVVLILIYTLGGGW